MLPEQRTKTNVGVGMAVFLQLAGLFFVQTNEHGGHSRARSSSYQHTGIHLGLHALRRGKGARRSGWVWSGWPVSLDWWS